MFKVDKTYIHIFLKWLLMGASDIVPWVSWWTIAFITGIYSRLISALSNINPSLIPLLFQWQIKKIRKKVDGNFLLSLFWWVFVSILSLAKIIEQLLANKPHLVFWLFAGLIVGSIFLIIKKVSKRSRKTRVAIALWTCLWFLIIQLVPLSSEPHRWLIILSAAIAICAMILPGISGSFLLLIMGMYGHTLSAIHEFDIVFILLFALGAITGLLSFVHGVKRALEKHHDTTIAVLTGLMIGALPKVRPRQNIISQEPYQSTTVLPIDYMHDPQIISVIFLFVWAFLGITLIEKHTQTFKRK